MVDATAPLLGEVCGERDEDDGDDVFEGEVVNVEAGIFDSLLVLPLDVDGEDFV